MPIIYKGTIMKLKQIALLVAGLSASAAVFAAPVTQQEITDARSAGTLQQAWISGASAPSKSVYEGWVGSGAGVGCDVGTNSIFTSQGGTNEKPGGLGNFLAYACRRGGVVSVLYHTIDGGSLHAYTPHTIGAKLGRLKYVGTTGVTNCTAPISYVDPTNNDNNAAVYKSCALAGAALPGAGPTSQSNTTNGNAVAADPFAPQLPVGGFSDVEAGLFSSAIGGGNVSSKGVESDANVGQVFGVAVSIPLYRALQAAQGLSDVNSSTYDTANAPNITRAQYVAIVAQGGAANGDWTPILGSNPGNVRVERRVNTSGSQASSNAFFLASPCASGVGASLTPAAATDSTSTYIVTENSGSGNVKSRLTTASLPATLVEDRYAIGVLSAENSWVVDTPAGNGGYRFVKLDGVHPEAGDAENARVTAAKGQYAFHMEMKNFVRSNYAGAPAKTAFENNIIGQITAALSNPPASACAVLPRGLTLNPFGGSSCTPGAQIANVSNLGKNCSPAQILQ